ncbi:hypothetical protein QFZ75_008007 [Streptomyces sp. V3I8]|uniref:hypothetical protein n=1 Tax=Streptomyces sp. V3I8 TaxID=3042279 RepID=UPI00278B0917|nr:hypothetical protein [Streptomyces sp. V3I8]MDQ1041505.1 hypothetical protein [Streptomyces sp. V3I8]
MNAEKSPRPAAGKPPSVTAVIKFLKSAGFQHARYAESLSQGGAAGAKVRAHHMGKVSVTWSEGDKEFFRRMADLGHTSVAGVPVHPDTEQHAREYAEALSPRYSVHIHDGTTVYLDARETLPVRPKGVPTAITVRKALAAAGAARASEMFMVVSVVDQPDHTRVAVLEGERLDAVRKALEAEGWTFETGEAIEHYFIKITGSTPDRPARLRKLRAARAAKEERKSVEAKFLQRVRAADAPQKEPSPVGSYVAWAEGPQERTEHGYVMAERDSEALVLGLDGGFRQMPADIPETVSEEPQAPAAVRDGKGRVFRVGQRVSLRTRDGFLEFGEITEFGKLDDGTQTLTFTADTRQLAPISRPIKGVPPRREKIRPIDPPRISRVALDKRINPA